MDSLLTDEEIKDAAFHRFLDGNRRVANRKKNSGRLVADAEHAKTLKAVAEWGNETCWNGLHSEENIIAVRQMECPDCQDELLEAAAKGKMPGEEK